MATLRWRFTRFIRETSTSFRSMTFFSYLPIYFILNIHVPIFLLYWKTFLIFTVCWGKWHVMNAATHVLFIKFFLSLFFKKLCFFKTKMQILYEVWYAAAENLSKKYIYYNIWCRFLKYRKYVFFWERLKIQVSFLVIVYRTFKIILLNTTVPQI